MYRIRYILFSKDLEIKEMSTPQADSSPVQNPTTTQTAVGSGNAAADAEAAAKKASMANESSSSSILTSGAGVLEDASVKKNLLG